MKKARGTLIVHTTEDGQEDTSPAVAELGAIFVDPDAYADPERWHQAAARIRAEAPILKVDLPGYPPFWAITKHADVMEVERHPRGVHQLPGHRSSWTRSASRRCAPPSLR